MTAVELVPRRPAILLLVYFVLILGAVVAFFEIERQGNRLYPPVIVNAVSDAPSNKSTIPDVVFHVLVTLSAIIALGNLLSVALKRFGQPPVIGEVVAGILLGPSLLGAISPDAMHFLIPSPETDPQRLVLATLQAIAQLGVVLYMFLVGLELNTQKVRGHAQAAIAISHAGIVFPFVLGAALALWLYPRVSSNDVSFTSFALFLGVAMSITAFPVLARILTDRRLAKSDMGVIALSCAATDDVTAWCLLAFVVGVVKTQVGSAVWVVILSTAFIAVMFLIVKPLVSKWIAWMERRNRIQQATPILLIAVMCSAVCTEAIGIHAVFGAFLLGAIVPNHSRIAGNMTNKLNDVVTTLFLPAFFAVTGMNTSIGLISGPESWIQCLAIIVVATVGKFGGTLFASRLTGIDWRTSAALGVLMNTRGLMELIVLNIGLSLGVISPKLFAMMMLMALATTVATAPILKRLVPEGTDRAE